MRPISAVALASAFLLASCSHNNTQHGAETSETMSGSSANYAARVGVAVATPTRTCIAIQNAALKPDASIVLVSARAPQTFEEAQVTGTSTSPCPVTKEVNPSVSSYDIRPSGPPVQALSPLIAVVATAPVFKTGPDNSVQADLDQNGKTESFRVCSANDGVHLTMWDGKPLDSKLLWQGYYYEASNPGIGPMCNLHELSGP